MRKAVPDGRVFRGIGVYSKGPFLGEHSEEMVVRPAKRADKSTEDDKIGCSAHRCLRTLQFPFSDQW